MASFAEKSLPVLMLLFGSLVLAISLLTANRTSAGDRTRLMSRKVYFSRTILPDNVLYPFVMAGDRVKLETAGFEEQILLRVEYADRRYQYAEQLIEKDQAPLALTTLTKSQKYLFAAGHEVLKDPALVDPETTIFVQKAFEHSLVRLTEIKQNYADQDAQMIDDLHRETTAIYQKLSTINEQNKQN